MKQNLLKRRILTYWTTTTTNHVAVQTFTNDPKHFKVVNANRKKIYM